MRQDRESAHVFGKPRPDRITVMCTGCALNCIDHTITTKTYPDIIKQSGQYCEKGDTLFILKTVESIKPERNGPCYCGSGKKYKKCCGNLAA
ncbi:SEC-C metal-binding domain-containing protein [Acinetobacter sp.]|uniref:SEC-C metal-binding domain-containing protein n=1 Tax=Acinetobacter sp. TaxID=472 RepID=UPI003D072E23